MGTSPAIVYITEVARPDLRGSMISLAPTLASLGENNIRALNNTQTFVRAHAFVTRVSYTCTNEIARTHMDHSCYTVHRFA